MRQAGRYLPEYRALRAKAGGFLDLCLNPDFATEITLQPVRRFDLDAAILFADILLIPMALGRKLWFEAGEGPRLDPVKSLSDIASFRDRDIHAALAPVYETVRRTRASLAPDKALIGFAGAPWTVATYMIAGQGTKEPAALRALWYGDRTFLTELIDRLVEATSAYLVRQVEAGTDAVQLFDTWAGGLPPALLEPLSVDPMRRIASAVTAAKPGTPVIFFPRGVGAMAKAYAALPECDAIGIDYATPVEWARRELSPHAVVQGGLDPLLAVNGGAEMEDEARRLLETFKGVPYVFNFGHGLTPEANPDHVARLVAIARGAGRSGKGEGAQ
jgi:uroporphyrinogen decarboxylase